MNCSSCGSEVYGHWQDAASYISLKAVMITVILVTNFETYEGETNHLICQVAATPQLSKTCQTSTTLQRARYTAGKKITLQTTK